MTTTPAPDAPTSNQAAPEPNGGPPPAQTSSQIVKREPIAVGERGVKLTTFDDIYRFARVVVASKFCPPNFTDADCFICISRGLEIGMSPLMSLENIYIVNNRATIFGDAPKALVEASGLLESYEQSFEGTPFDDDFRAVVTSTRKGRKPMTETFSVADAKRAELWDKKSREGKPGPWILYPKRMLMFRARGYNLRDNFGDVLKGFQIGELVDDPGFENARRASGRVVEPNFSNGTPAQPENALPKAWQQQQAESADLQAQKRHRRTKAEMEAARAQENAPQANVAPATGTPARTSLFPEPEKKEEPAVADEPPTTNGPAGEIMKRLKAADISQERFLVLLADVGAIDVKEPAISQGHYVIGHVEREVLMMALADWENVLLRLKGATQS
jgi:hypothetical protein